MDKKNKISTTMEEKLQKRFSPFMLKIEDVSEMHRGHGGFKEGGETHFIIYINCAEFKDKNKLAVHRLINEELKDEWENGVHSISIKTEA